MKYLILTPLAIFIILAFSVSCEKSDDEKTMDVEQLIGHWINPVYTDTVLRFEKANSLKDNDYGISFKTDQVFIERKNSGWCATPPITYADFDGTWSRHDSILNITVGYWGGTADYQWKILAIDNNHLTIYRVHEEYHNSDF
jgi:hypothetical protein